MEDDSLKGLSYTIGHRLYELTDHLGNEDHLLVHHLSVLREDKFFKREPRQLWTALRKTKVIYFSLKKGVITIANTKPAHNENTMMLGNCS